MDYCLFEPINGREPEWDCSKRDCEKCSFWYVDVIQRIIAAWKKESGVKTPVLYKIEHKKKTMIVFTTRPGLMIGFKGRLVEKYKELLQKERADIKHIEFTECEEGVF